MRKIYSNFVQNLKRNMQPKKRHSPYDEYAIQFNCDSFLSDRRVFEEVIKPLIISLRLIETKCPNTIAKEFPNLSINSCWLQTKDELYIDGLLESSHEEFLYELDKHLPDSYNYRNTLCEIISAKREVNDHAFLRIKRLETFLYSLVNKQWICISVDESDKVEEKLAREIFKRSLILDEFIRSLARFIKEQYNEYSRFTRIKCLGLKKSRINALWEKSKGNIGNPNICKKTYYHVFGDTNLPEHENPHVILWNGTSSALREHIEEIFQNNSIKWTQLKTHNIFRIRKKGEYVVPSYNSYRNHYTPHAKNMN